MKGLAIFFLVAVAAAAPSFAQMKAVPAKPGGKIQGKADRTEKVTISISDFYGHYVGRGVTKSHGARYYGLADRDLDVVIEKAEAGGFKLTWTTIRRRAKKSKRRSTQTLSFVPTGRPNTWKAKKSGELMNGEPVIWARLNGPKLYVYVVVSNAKTGVFEAAVYVRELVQDGMQLRFRRVRDGSPARSVVAYLKRVKK